MLRDREHAENDLKLEVQRLKVHEKDLLERVNTLEQDKKVLEEHTVGHYALGHPPAVSSQIPWYRTLHQW